MKVNHIKYTARLKATIAELSSRGMSDEAISCTLELYENLDVSASGVRGFRQRNNIRKPISQVKQEASQFKKTLL
jgi:hypothetical protein